MRGTHLRSLIFNRPLMIHPGKLNAIVMALADRVGVEPTGLEIEASIEEMNSRPRRSFQVSNGVAVIPVVGSLVHRTTGLDAMSGLMSYGSIGARLKEAVADTSIKGILLEVDSPGGEVGGCFDLADRIFEARQSKPVWAIANDAAFSAAYALACAADRFFVTRTGTVGSIGVIAWHLDQSALDAGSGLRYTPIFAGAHKKDFNPHEPLKDAAREKIQSLVDYDYGIFTAAVARNRGISDEAVRATEANIFTPDEALEAGLVDGIKSFREVLGEMAGLNQSGPIVSAGSGLAARMDQPEEESMSNQLNPQATQAAQSPQAEQPQQAAGPTAEQSKADERARIQAITICEEAQGRQKMAEHLAFNTSMSVENAKSLLATAPVEAAQAEPEPEPAAQGDQFAQAMSKVENPDVGADGEEIQPGADLNDQHHLAKAMADRHGIKDYRPGRG